MTPELLRQAIGCTAEAAQRYAGPLSAGCAFYGIDTPERLAAFLAQLGHESASLKYAAELWGPTPAQLRYERDFSAPWPESAQHAKLAQYERNRLAFQLGNTEAGDGKRFSGHGPIQITGRYNHARVRDRLRERFPTLAVPDFEADPQALCLSQWGALAACDYWDDRQLNALADAGDFEAITRKVNGALNGYADRLARWARAQGALAGATTTAAAEGGVIQQGDTMSTASDILSSPITKILLAAVNPILGAVPEIAHLFMDKEGTTVPERNTAAALKMVEVARTALTTAGIEAPNAQAVAEAIAADPAAKAAVRQALLASYFEIKEAGGGGIEGAAKRDAAFTIGGANPLKSPALLISLLLFTLPLMLAVDLFYVHPNNYPGELRTQIVTAILLVIGMVGAFWLGSSFGSTRKTELAGQQ